METIIIIKILCNIPCSVSNSANSVCLHFKVTYFPCGNVFIPRNHGNVHFECKLMRLVNAMFCTMLGSRLTRS